MPKTRDPLTMDERVERFRVESGAEEFFVRAPPSVVPPTLPIASTSTIPPAPSPTQAAAPARRLSEEEVEELRRLRRTDPAKWTRAALADKFGVSETFVGLCGFGNSSDGRLAAKLRQRQIGAELEERQQKWGWRKQIAREERQRRRSMW